MSFSNQAYIKPLLHAANYPSCTVIGLLLADAEANVVDCLPLLHHWTDLSPMLEIGLSMVRCLAQYNMVSLPEACIVLGGNLCSISETVDLRLLCRERSSWSLYYSAAGRDIREEDSGDFAERRNDLSCMCVANAAS